MLACLDELPSTAPLPTLRTRMANERALGISFIYAAQTWRQLASLFGDTDARALFGLTNVLVMFGGSKDVAFNKEVSDLVGTTRVTRTTWQLGQTRRTLRRTATTCSSCGPKKSDNSPRRHALIVAENSKPIIARLTRCIDGKTGQALLAQQREVRQQLQLRRDHTVSADARSGRGARRATERDDQP